MFREEDRQTVQAFGEQQKNVQGRAQRKGWGTLLREQGGSDDSGTQSPPHRYGQGATAEKPHRVQVHPHNPLKRRNSVGSAAVPLQARKQEAGQGRCASWTDGAGCIKRPWSNTNTFGVQCGGVELSKGSRRQL